MRVSTQLAFSTVLLMALSVACGDDDDGETACDPFDDGTCPGSSVCEETDFGEPACFAPVEVRGEVFDSLDDTGVQGATVVARDANGFAVSEVVETDDNGDYSLNVPTVRGEDGVPLDAFVTLRVDAAEYQSFPKAPRTALPIDLTTATELDDPDDDALVVQNPSTNVALIPLEGDTSSLARIDGTVDHADAQGVLVVATQGDSAVSTAVSGVDGEFVLFNVPLGNTTVDGFRVGINVDAETIDVVATDNESVVLLASSDGLSSINGSVSIVNAPGGLTTSVILALESTFDPIAITAEAPAGLRAGEVSGGSSFTIEDVPPGDYVALAAYENDLLVRDPDEGISGTDIVYISVEAGDGEVDFPESFKVTEALAVISPGAEGLEVIDDSTPTFVWADDAGEEGYELRVFDSFGALVLEDLEVPRVTGSETVSYEWHDAELDDGMIYQFKVASFDDTNDGRQYQATTEDLLGVFMFSAASE